MFPVGTGDVEEVAHLNEIRVLGLVEGLVESDRLVCGTRLGVGNGNFQGNEVIQPRD